ncbi:O-antigen ligase [Paraglaciecola sp. L1A13]|uniref:O-antigen ligase family protein n=1 Tax=Paraglaciecola sp. L1A13 TaxID=2686359 RepID=UPI001E5EB195|nr:O-antigen ligase family protein [Paraglaciecola sp. L1A13]
MQIKLQIIERLLLVLAATVIPLYFTDLRLSLPGVIIRLADISSITIIGLYFVLARHRRIVWCVPHGYQMVFVFIGYCLLLGLLKSSLKDAIVESVQWALLLVVIGIVYGQSIKYPKEFQALFLKALLMICIFVVLYHFAHGKYYHYKDLGDAKYILALTGVVLVSHIYFFNNKKYIFPLIILYPFILLSLERKGILAFHIVSLIYLIMAYRYALKWLLMGAFGFGVVLLMLAPNMVDLAEFSFFNYSDVEIYYLDEDAALWVSNLHRQSLVTFGWDIFQKNIFFGVGPKMLANHMINYFYSPNLALYTHNVFLDILIEYGVFGLILLLFPYFIFGLKNNFNSIRQRDCFLCLLAYSIIMLFFMSSGAPSMLLFYFPLCMGFAFNSAALADTKYNK